MSSKFQKYEKKLYKEYLKQLQTVTRVKEKNDLFGGIIEQGLHNTASREVICNTNLS